MAKWIQLASSKKNFLIQDPDECALTLERAFPNPGQPILGEVYAQQMIKDHPLPPELAPTTQPEAPDAPGV